MITGILRNAKCYVKCSSYQNHEGSLCKAGEDLVCDQSKQIEAKQEYDECKENICHKSKVGWSPKAQKQYKQCKKDHCDSAKLTSAKSEFESCQSYKEKAKKIPKNVVAGNRECYDDGYACQTACWTTQPENNR